MYLSITPEKENWLQSWKNFCPTSYLISNVFSFYNSRPGSSESVGRCVHQWPTTPESRSSPNRGDGRPRRQTLHDFATTPGVSRMRFQDSESIPGDRQHSAGCDRRQQTQSFDARRRATNRRLPKGEPGYIHLGDTRSIGKSKLFISLRIEIC